MIELLKEKLEYKTDGLYWKAGKFAGKRAGCVRPDGYRTMSLNIEGKKKSYLEHRLCFYYMNGRWPTEIDHIDRNKQNNSWSNLRECTRSENNRNKDILGVHFYKQTSRWRAEIKANGTTYHLGYYKNFDDALKARETAQTKLWI